eukprot:891877-Pleurochrysis_carterae.AAC.5
MQDHLLQVEQGLAAACDLSRQTACDSSRQTAASRLSAHRTDTEKCGQILVSAHMGYNSRRWRVCGVGIATSQQIFKQNAVCVCPASTTLSLRRLCFELLAPLPLKRGKRELLRRQRKSKRSRYDCLLS